MHEEHVRESGTAQSIYYKEKATLTTSFRNCGLWTKGYLTFRGRDIEKTHLHCSSCCFFLIPIDFIVMLWGFQCPHISLGQTYIILSHPTVL